MPPLTSFVLPGGTPGAAAAHLARTVARRAERAVVRLAAEEAVNPDVVRYLNRLSDLLFVLSRRLNDNGARDVLWRAGRSGAYRGLPPGPRALLLANPKSRSGGDPDTVAGLLRDAGLDPLCPARWTARVHGRR